jgi:hypothetical protein
MSEVINLNNATPAAPSGSLNVTWQKGASTGTDGATGLPIDPVSASLPKMVGDTGAGGVMGLVPAPAAGDAAAGKVLKADGTWYVPPAMPLPLSIGFVMLSGATGTDVGPMLVAPRAGSLTKCTVVVKTSDPVTGLSFRIKRNGTDIFSTDPSIAAAAASGSIDTFTALTSSPLAVASGDVFSIDVLTGSAAWSFTAQLS